MADWTAYVKARLSLPGLRHDREAEIVEDLARQLDDAYREALSSGATETEARLRAERHIGDWDQLGGQLAASARARLTSSERWQQDADDRRVDTRGRFPLGTQLRQDFFYAWRMLLQGRGVTLVAVISLAIGIGANTAMFTVINALLFRTLPVSHPSELVAISDPDASGLWTGVENGDRTMFSYHEFEGLRDHNSVLSGIVAFNSSLQRVPVATGEEDQGRATPITTVSGSYFATLGIQPAAGRVFGEEVDAARLANPVAVLSDAFWRSRMLSRVDAVGQTIRVSRTTFTVIGILPPSFTGLVVGDAPDLYVPLTMQQAVQPGRDWLTQPPGTARRTMFLHVVGRLKPGVTLSQADASLNVIFRQGLDAEGALIADADRRRQLLDARIVVRDARHGLSPLRGEYRQPLVLLMGLVALLLLLACVNVANLLLARATARRREMAMRVALGASRARVIRQLLTESLMLSVCGAVAGVWLGKVGVYGLLRLVSGSATPVPLDAHLDLTVLAFTAGVTLLTGVLFGLAPAIRATRLDLNVVLRGTATNVAGTGRGVGRWPLGKTLAAAQVALSLMLIVAAGLFVRTLQNLGSVPLGFDAAHVLMFRIDPVANGYAPAAVAPFYEDLLTKLSSVAGVGAASFSDNGLFYGADSSDDVSFPDDQMPAGLDMGAHFDSVGPRYFGTIGVPVLAGRDVESQDATGARPCWLGQTMAQKFFKNNSPLGHRMIIHYSFGDEECAIRGIVADARVNSLRDEIGSRFYQPFLGNITKPSSAIIELRVNGDPAAVESAVRRALRDTNAALPPPNFHTVPDLIDSGLARDRLTARLSSLFGALALVLAAIGLYGVLSYSVSRRVGEIGVRLALGAERGNILRLVLGEALLIAAIGAAIGLAGALAATRFLGALLFGLGSRDPVTLSGALAVLLVVAILAAALPAWRASRTDPIRALRSE